MPSVTRALSIFAKRRRPRYDARSRTSAAEAESSIMIGDSISHASDVATPNAARPRAASGIRATIAAMYGPSSAIMNHVAASGSQNRTMPRVESVGCAFMAARIVAHLLRGSFVFTTETQRHRGGRRKKLGRYADGSAAAS
jgi:hypothetical protein